jgi:hypothetical protein
MCKVKLFTCRSIITGFVLKRVANSLAWGRSEPFQGSWAYLGAHRVTPGAIAQFLGAWEVWHYGLWSFQGRDTKLERFLAKNQLYSNEINKF